MAGLDWLFGNTAGLMARLDQLDTTVAGQQQVLSGPDITKKPFKKVLTTNAAGVYSGPLGGANYFSAEPVVVITPKMGAGNFDWRYTLTGDAATGYTITVTFVKRVTSIVGNLTTLLAGIALADNPVTVAFSLIAAEPTPDTP